MGSTRRQASKHDLLLFCELLGARVSARATVPDLVGVVLRELRELPKAGGQCEVEVRAALHRLLLVDPDEEWIVDEEIPAPPAATGIPADHRVTVSMLTEPGNWASKRLLGSGRTRFLAYLDAVEEVARDVARVAELTGRKRAPTPAPYPSARRVER